MTAAPPYPPFATHAIGESKSGSSLLPVYGEKVAAAG
jgi:hypothetical protein